MILDEPGRRSAFDGFEGLDVRIETTDRESHAARLPRPPLSLAGEYIKGHVEALPIVVVPSWWFHREVEREKEREREEEEEDPRIVQDVVEPALVPRFPGRVEEEWRHAGYLRGGSTIACGLFYNYS